jgi:hypothetical protein
MEAEWAA